MRFSIAKHLFAPDKNFDYDGNKFFGPDKNLSYDGKVRFCS
ncbi:hypothetical protein [Mucilaginibacter phenanthrenivorans]|nr:hypothetical protein [Mucilaginibacter phenanthrenivorans]